MYLLIKLSARNESGLRSEGDGFPLSFLSSSLITPYRSSIINMSLAALDRERKEGRCGPTDGLSCPCHGAYRYAICMHAEKRGDGEDMIDMDGGEDGGETRDGLSKKRTLHTHLHKQRFPTGRESMY